MGIERRRHRRIEIELAAVIRPADSHAGGTRGTITNLGPEGAYVNVDGDFEVGSRVSMDFEIDSYSTEINVYGEVLWRKDGAEPGIGLRFTNIPLFEKNAIGDYILRKVAELKSGRFD